MNDLFETLAGAMRPQKIKKTNIDVFKQKEQRIKKAIKKVKTELNNFATGNRKDVENWNNYHDLVDRLNDRLWQNWSEYKDWHWNNFGFNVY